jgi:hypothetical protein
MYERTSSRCDITISCGIDEHGTGHIDGTRLPYGANAGDAASVHLAFHKQGMEHYVYPVIAYHLIQDNLEDLVIKDDPVLGEPTRLA